LVFMLPSLCDLVAVRRPTFQRTAQVIKALYHPLSAQTRCGCGKDHEALRFPRGVC